MYKYFVRRIIWIIPTLWLASTLVFAMVHIMPGDPVMVILGSSAGADQVDLMRHKLGLDQPIFVQYSNWLCRIVQGDLGNSIITDQSVIGMILDRLPTTMTIAAAALLLSLCLSIPAGIIASLRHNTYIDYIFMGIAALGVSLPSFWLALLLILLFSVKLKMLPMVGFISIFESFGQGVEYLILPAISLALVMIAMTARMTRSSMLEVLREDFITTAVAKGTPQRLVVLKHALKNAFAPILTVIGFQIGFLLGGTVVIEDVYSIPGVGKLIFQAIASRDYPVVQGCLLMVTFINVIINTMIDFAYAYFDPKVSYGR
jgi:peptide/nickel transport system permease protein